MQKLAYILFFISFYFSSNAQYKKHNWFLGIQAALLNGYQSSNALVSAKGGIYIKEWCVGIGTGIDYYQVRSVPVFLSTQYHLFSQKKLFVYADVGANTAWAKENQHNENGFWGVSPSSFVGGIYTDAGVGTYIDKKHRKIFVSVGYSVKTMKENFQELIFNPSNATLTPVLRSYDYTFNRLVFKLGIKI